MPPKHGVRSALHAIKKAWVGADDERDIADLASIEDSSANIRELEAIERGVQAMRERHMQWIRNRNQVDSETSINADNATVGTNDAHFAVRKKRSLWSVSLVDDADPPCMNVATQHRPTALRERRFHEHAPDGQREHAYETVTPVKMRAYERSAQEPRHSASTSDLYKQYEHRAMPPRIKNDQEVRQPMAPDSGVSYARMPRHAASAHQLRPSNFWGEKPRFGGMLGRFSDTREDAPVSQLGNDGVSAMEILEKRHLRRRPSNILEGPSLRKSSSRQPIAYQRSESDGYFERSSLRTSASRASYEMANRQYDRAHDSDTRNWRAYVSQDQSHRTHRRPRNWYSSYNSKPDISYHSHRNESAATTNTVTIAQHSPQGSQRSAANTSMDERSSLARSSMTSARKRSLQRIISPVPCSSSLDTEHEAPSDDEGMPRKGCWPQEQAIARDQSDGSASREDLPLRMLAEILRREASIAYMATSGEDSSDERDCIGRKSGEKSIDTDSHIHR